MSTNEGLQITNQELEISKEELRSLNAALKRSDERMRAILNTAVDAIITIDHDGTITGANPATERMFGYTQDELIGQNVRILMPPPYRDEHDRYIARYLRTGESRIIGIGREVTHLRKDGSTFPAELVVSHVRSLSMFTGVIRDISERKRAEERERQHQADLAHMLRVATAGELATGLAHELSQPLTAISNNIQACLSRIRTGKVDGSSLLKPLKHASEEAQRAGTIVHSIRDMVEKRPPRYESVDLRDPIRKMVTLVNGKMAEHGIELRIEGADKPIPVHVDTIQIEQVLINLVQNAIDSICEAGRKTKRISITASRAREGTVEIGVRDTGAGVSEAAAERIFTPFFSTKEHGLGMGLALSRTIIEAHGGRLWLEPQRNRRSGSTFRFALPVYAKSKGRETGNDARRSK